MKLKELQGAMIAAMKAKDKFRKDAISALVSAVKKKGCLLYTSDAADD